MADIQACTDHGCIYGHPGGMGTNGGCKCLYELPLDKRRRAETNIRALRAQLAEAQAEAAKLMAKTVQQSATIARQRAWIEKAGHRPGCASTRKCTHCGKPPWSYRHLVDAVGFDHDFQPGPCTCGWSELVGG